jgi:membrane protease YdiL (CAAX protease family)
MSVQTKVKDAALAARSRLRSPNDGRLRAGWRILSFLAIFYALALPLLFGSRELLHFSKSSPLVIVIIALAATPAVYIARRWIDTKSCVSLGLHWNARAGSDLVFGFLLSGFMAAVVFAAMFVLGFIGNVQVAVNGWSAASLLVVPFLTMALVGFWEELVFRGYILQNMAEGLGMNTAIIVSCILYGLVHSANPNAGLLSTAIIVLFGYLRIYGLLSTGQLWLSIGMHTGWNFFQGTVFGFAASGHTEDRTLITHDTIAADWLSGGAFGPEASVLTVAVVLVALVIMRAWSRRPAPDPAPVDPRTSDGA